MSDFGPAGATGGVWECPDLFALPVDGKPDDDRWVLDVDINPGGVAGGSGGQYFVGYVRRHAIRQREPTGDDALGRLRQGLLRDDLVFGHPAHRRPADLDGVDQQLAVRQRGADGHLAWRPVSPSRAGASSAARRDSSRATAGRRAARAADISRARCDARADDAAGVRRASNSRSSQGRGATPGIRLSNQAGEEVVVGVTSTSARGVRRPPQVAPDARSPRVPRPPRQARSAGATAGSRFASCSTGPSSRSSPTTARPWSPTASSRPSPSIAWRCSRAAARDTRRCGRFERAQP